MSERRSAGVRRGAGRATSARVLETLAAEVDAEDPTPLYHQITRALRWQIVAGALAPGDVLPSMRAAAEALGVHFHTVRRAYEELADAGLTESRAGAGTRVAGGAAEVARGADAPGAGRGGRSAAVEEFVDVVVDAARERYGLAVPRLADLVAARAAAEAEPAAARPAVSDPAAVVECDDHCCGELAEQLAGRFGIDARPWPLEDEGEPPEGVIVSTYHHYTELRRRWPGRVADMRFLAVVLDPELRARVAERAASLGTKMLVLCADDLATARELAGDLSLVLPPDFRLKLTTAAPSSVLSRGASDRLVLVAPARWRTLEASEREDERVVELRHVFAPAALNALAAAWRR